ncbi:hypothetical protein FBU31_004763, partial [Coemansia sp. 'formosensis']
HRCLCCQLCSFAYWAQYPRNHQLGYRRWQWPESQCPWWSSSCERWWTRHQGPQTRSPSPSYPSCPCSSNYRGLPSIL